MFLQQAGSDLRHSASVGVRACAGVDCNKRLSGPIPAELGGLDMSKTKALKSLTVRWPKKPPTKKYQAFAFLPIRRLL